MPEITYRAQYSGHVDGEKVAWMYRAYNEDGAPYVLAVDYEFGPLTIVQAPTEFLDGVADEEADRENAIDWVHRLTELVDKAKAYDEIFDAVEEAECELDPSMCGLPNPVTLSDIIHDFVVEDDDDDAYVVDELTDAETDTEWVDRDGDHYKFICGEWHFSYAGDGPWEPVTEPGYPLTSFGPYTAVGE